MMFVVVVAIAAGLVLQREWWRRKKATYKERNHIFLFFPFGHVSRVRVIPQRCSKSVAKLLFEIETTCDRPSNRPMPGSTTMAEAEQCAILLLLSLLFSFFFFILTMLVIILLYNNYLPTLTRCTHIPVLKMEELHYTKERWHHHFLSFTS